MFLRSKDGCDELSYLPTVWTRQSSGRQVLHELSRPFDGRSDSTRPTIGCYANRAHFPAGSNADDADSATYG